MYPLLHSGRPSRRHRYDPDRLDRGTPFARPVPAAGSGPWSRSLASVRRCGQRPTSGSGRATLGPLPDPCAGDPAGQGW